MDNSFTFGDYYKDIKLRRVEHHFLSKVDRIFIELNKQFNLRSEIVSKLKKSGLESIKVLERRYTKKISKIRYIVERTFGTLHKDYGYDRSRYFGLAKTDFFLKLGAISFNLKRVLKIVSTQTA